MAHIVWLLCAPRTDIFNQLQSSSLENQVQLHSFFWSSAQVATIVDWTQKMSGLANGVQPLLHDILKILFDILILYFIWYSEIKIKLPESFWLGSWLIWIRIVFFFLSLSPLLRYHISLVIHVTLQREGRGFRDCSSPGSSCQVLTGFAFASLMASRVILKFTCGEPSCVPWLRAT